MSLESAIDNIVTRLRQGAFPNEQSISQGIVLRVLNELGWDTWDTNVVWPEFQTGEGRADYALCHPPSKPAVFVEVKQPGKAEEGIRQALEYAFHTGVPFVVLTDGRTWSFYLPAEQGSYEDRRVYKLDLLERPVPEAADVLKRYLEYDRVTYGEALQSAREEYHNRNRRGQARAAIPEAWRELVDSGSPALVELIANHVETKIGIRPEPGDVAQFLSQLHVASAQPIEMEQLANRAENSPPLAANTLLICGRQFSYRSAKEVMVIVLRELAARDPTFLERCARHPRAQGKRRRYIARSPQELYPHRPDLRDQCEALPGGWYVGTNLSNSEKLKILNMAAEVAGLRFGRDIVVHF